LVFVRLSVFASSFDAAAASTVMRADGIEPRDVLDALGSLVAKSLLVDDDGPDGTTRYHLLETLREYATERLVEMGEVDVTRRHHANHFATLAEEIGPGFLGPDELRWRHRLRADVENFRTAVAWSLGSEHQQDLEAAVRIVAAFGEATVLDSSLGVGRWAEAAAHWVAASDPQSRCIVLAAAALSNWARGEWTMALELCEEALQVERSNLGGITLFPYEAGALIHGFIGDLEGALAIAADGLHVAEGRPPDSGQAYLRVVASIACGVSGDYTRAHLEAGEAIQLARESGQPTAMTLALCVFGWSGMHEDPQAALAALTQSIELTRSGATNAIVGHALSGRALLHMRTGATQSALDDLREAVAQSHDVGDRSMLMTAIDRGIAITTRVGALETAATFAGIVTHGTFAGLSINRFGPDAIEREQLIERLPVELGVATWETAIARGAAMAYDEIVEYALSELERLEELAEVSTPSA
jgi:hypothetical protein